MVEKLKSFCANKKAMPLLICVFLLGIIIVVSAPDSEKEDKLKMDTTETSSQDKKLSDNTSSEEYRLKEILSKIEGVGEVDVFINYKSDKESVPLKDSDENGKETTVMKSEGGKTEPYITKNMRAEIEGVIVVAQGGGNKSLAITISEAVADVYSIPMHKVKILKMK